MVKALGAVTVFVGVMVAAFAWNASSFDERVAEQRIEQVRAATVTARALQAALIAEFGEAR